MCFTLSLLVNNSKLHGGSSILNIQNIDTFPPILSNCIIGGSRTKTEKEKAIDSNRLSQSNDNKILKKRSRSQSRHKLKSRSTSSKRNSSPSHKSEILTNSNPKTQEIEDEKVIYSLSFNKELEQFKIYVENNFPKELGLFLLKLQNKIKIFNLYSYLINKLHIIPVIINNNDNYTELEEPINPSFYLLHNIDTGLTEFIKNKNNKVFYLIKYIYIPISDLKTVKGNFIELTNHLIPNILYIIKAYNKYYNIVLNDLESYIIYTNINEEYSLSNTLEYRNLKFEINKELKNTYLCVSLNNLINDRYYYLDMLKGFNILEEYLEIEHKNYNSSLIYYIVYNSLHRNKKINLKEFSSIEDTILSIYQYQNNKIFKSSYEKKLILLDLLSKYKNPKAILESLKTNEEPQNNCSHFQIIKDFELDKINSKEYIEELLNIALFPNHNGVFNPETANVKYIVNHYQEFLSACKFCKAELVCPHIFFINSPYLKLFFNKSGFEKFQIFCKFCGEKLNEFIQQNYKTNFSLIVTNEEKTAIKVGIKLGLKIYDCKQFEFFTLRHYIENLFFELYYSNVQKYKSQQNYEIKIINMVTVFTVAFMDTIFSSNTLKYTVNSNKYNSAISKETGFLELCKKDLKNIDFSRVLGIDFKVKNNFEDSITILLSQIKIGKEFSNTKPLTETIQYSKLRPYCPTNYIDNRFIPTKFSLFEIYDQDGNNIFKKNLLEKTNLWNKLIYEDKSTDNYSDPPTNKKIIDFYSDKLKLSYSSTTIIDTDKEKKLLLNLSKINDYEYKSSLIKKMCPELTQSLTSVYFHDYDDSGICLKCGLEFSGNNASNIITKYPKFFEEVNKENTLNIKNIKELEFEYIDSKFIEYINENIKLYLTSDILDTFNNFYELSSAFIFNIGTAEETIHSDYKNKISSIYTQYRLFIILNYIQNLSINNAFSILEKEIETKYKDSFKYIKKNIHKIQVNEFKLVVEYLISCIFNIFYTYITKHNLKVAIQTQPKQTIIIKHTILSLINNILETETKLFIVPYKKIKISKYEINAKKLQLYEEDLDNKEKENIDDIDDADNFESSLNN